MKILSFIFFLFILFSSDSEDKFTGEYKNYFGSKIIINSDSSYNYTWRFGLTYSWINGKWTKIGDTILLAPVLIYDSLSYYDTLRNENIDTLVLSRDKHSTSISIEKHNGDFAISDCQNCYGSPRRLLYRNNRLYDINRDGSISDKEKTGLISNEKFPTYYFKIIE